MFLPSVEIRKFYVQMKIHLWLRIYVNKQFILSISLVYPSLLSAEFRIRQLQHFWMNKTISIKKKRFSGYETKLYLVVSL